MVWLWAGAPPRGSEIRVPLYLHQVQKPGRNEERHSVHQEHKGAWYEVKQKTRKRHDSVSKEAHWNSTISRWRKPFWRQPIAWHAIQTGGKGAISDLWKKTDTGRAKHLHRYFYICVKNIDQHKKRDQAEETLEALNQLSKVYNGLKTWAWEWALNIKRCLNAQGKENLREYYRAVVYNDIIENSAAWSSLTEQNAQHYWMATERIFSSSIEFAVDSNRT